MGQLTRSEIVVQGQAEAGQSGKNTRLLEALVLWEQSQFKAWPFGFLRKSKASLALLAGTTALSVGSGEGGITNMIQRILDPIYINNSGYTVKAKARIISLDQDDEEVDERVGNPALGRGLPTAFKIRHILSTVSPYRSCKSLIPFPVPDVAYQLNFDYIEIPITLQTDGSGISLYPNDQTMKKFVEMMATKWANGAGDADYQALRDELADMVQTDRIREGQSEGTNLQVPLDPAVYLP